MAKPRTLYDKIWDDHVVDAQPDGTCLLYIDRHLVHEVTSPAGLRGPARRRAARCASPRRRSRSSTTTCRRPTARTASTDPESATQVETLAQNATRFRHRVLQRARRPPGHRAHHRARAGLHAAGHDDRVRRLPHLDARRLRGARARDRHLRGRARARHADADPEEGEEHARDGRRAAARPASPPRTSSSSIIGEIGTAGGTGHVIEYAGEAIRSLSMEGRMTVCNMSIEGGARAGMVAPDEKTFAYLKDRPKAPKGAAWDAALRYWETLRSDEGAHFDAEIRLDAANLPPIVTWGTSPEDVVSVEGAVPNPDEIPDENKRALEVARPRLYGPQARHPDHRHRPRPGVHRLLHQRPHRGPARGRQGRRGPAGSPTASTR